jgi:hypothetical protein
MNAGARIGETFRAFRPQLRYGLRVTAAGLAAFGIARSFNIPLHGLWAVLTAIVVSQISVGGSLRATIEYNIGTLGGAVYAAAIGLAIPHTTPLMQALVLALSVGPLAFAAAINPSFRVAPFSAVLVLLIGSQLGESPIGSAVTRVVEVAIGGAVAVVVSLIVFPERAEGLRLEAASRILNVMADLLPRLFARLTRNDGSAEMAPMQIALSAEVAQFQTLAEEAKRERIVSVVRDPDPAPLSRTLLRIRNDFVMISSATVQPLPEGIARRLDPSLTRFGAEASAFLRGSAAALADRTSPPQIAAVTAALRDYRAEITALRGEGFERAMASDDVERFFALGFALEQLCRDFTDLVPRIEERVRR